MCELCSAMLHGYSHTQLVCDWEVIAKQHGILIKQQETLIGIWEMKCKWTGDMDGIPRTAGNADLGM